MPLPSIPGPLVVVVVVVVAATAPVVRGRRNSMTRRLCQLLTAVLLALLTLTPCRCDAKTRNDDFSLWIDEKQVREFSGERYLHRNPTSCRNASLPLREIRVHARNECVARAVAARSQESCRSSVCRVGR